MAGQRGTRHQGLGFGQLGGAYVRHNPPSCSRGAMFDESLRLLLPLLSCRVTF